MLPPATVGERGRITKATVDHPWEGDTLHLTSPDTGLQALGCAWQEFRGRRYSVVGLFRPRRVSFRRFPCFQLFSRAVGMRKEIFVNVRFAASLAGLLLVHPCYAEEAPQVTPEVVVTATRFWEPAQDLPVLSQPAI